MPSLTPQLTGHTARILGPFVGWSHACSAAIFAQLVALSRLGCSAVMSRPSISESSAHAPAAPTTPVALVLEVAVGVPANRTNKPGQPGRLGRQHKKASTGYARRVAAPIVARRRIGGGLHESRVTTYDMNNICQPEQEQNWSRSPAAKAARRNMDAAIMAAVGRSIVGRRQGCADAEVGK